MNELPLRYGTNPHQVPARVFSRDGGDLPFTVLNGQPGYVNLLDALNAWQLVRELKTALRLPAAASFKHVSPSGAAVGVPLSDDLRRSYFCEDVELSPPASAYARARGADRVCSYGDWAALSDPVDAPTAELLRREVSDGVIAPGFEPAALDVLKTKQRGAYRIIEADESYEPPPVERRDVFGVTFEQRRNDTSIEASLLGNVVTEARALPEAARRDLIVALVAVKYTQSNSSVFAHDGQTIGVGAGQQSRIHCVRLAGDKADVWHLRRHPATLGLTFRDGLGRPDVNNAIDGFLRDDLTREEDAYWRETYFDDPPQRLSRDEKLAWREKLDGVALASDAYIPFRDNIDRAFASGVRYVVQPGGSVRDEDVIGACDEYGMVMALSGVRLFHH